MLSYIPPASTEPTSRATGGSAVSSADAGRFASALDAAEQEGVATDHEADQSGSDSSGHTAGRQGRHAPSPTAERLTAAASQRGQLLGGAAVWQARDTSVLTGADAHAPVDTRSWEYEDYLQVRGTFGREIRDVVGDDPWLWELADQSGMGHPAPAVQAVIGQLAEQWAERVGYEDPGGNGTAVSVQYLRNPSGLAADHARFAGKGELPDLAALGADRTPGDTTPAPDPTAAPADPATSAGEATDDDSIDDSPQAGGGGLSQSQPAGEEADNVEVAAASAGAGLVEGESDATFASTGLGVQAAAGVDPVGQQLSELWDQAERDR